MLRRVFLALTILIAGGGCAGGDECTDAADKLKDCNIIAVGAGNCDVAHDKCEAGCINAYSCQEIQAALLGTQNGYSACDGLCN